ncbi:MAG: GDSL-type esterase/lipase family protein, partial [Acidobacteriota bacterium]
GVAQITPAPAEFPFIRLDRNLLLYSRPQALEPFFQSLDRLLSRGEGQVRIVHIGDSHIQADYFTGRVRERLHQYIPGSRAGRGFIFPYRVARTNSPPDYKVSYSGSWKRCRNIDKDSSCSLGVSGISVATTSAAAGIRIQLDPEWPVDYSFDRVRIFHSRGSRSFEAAISGVSNSRRRIDRQLGLTEFRLAAPRDSPELRLERTSPQQGEFVLHGISLESDGPGILYHSMGVNGADVEAYLRCEYLGEHLEVLDPGLVVISLGTNDAIANSFDRNLFLNQMESLISRVRMAVPQAAVLLTTPGDNYRRRRYLNRNNLQARQAILKAAQLTGGTVWDFFEVMGGLGSIRQWQNSNLSQRDRIHLTRPGYSLQGDLFFEALMRAYDGHLEGGGRQGKVGKAAG